MNHQKSYTQINGIVQLCQKRNQQFNWHGDFVFHSALKSEVSAINSDDTLFNIEDFEEQYFIQNTDSKYAVHILDDHTVRMSGSDTSEIDKSKGRYRKLTPRECLRLMGFSDDFKIVVSDTETYKQAGNSIIVDVLIALLRQIDITKYGI